MRRDSGLLHACSRGAIAGAVRLYSFSPACLSLGRLQDCDDVDAAACERDGVEVVRRPSGGRAVLHDQEVTYAVVCRTDDADFGGAVLDSCARIHQAVALGLARLGVATSAHGVSADERAAALSRSAGADCFARPSAHELIDDRGRKLVGSAQARLGGALLQHGSVLLAPPRAGVYLRSRGPRSAGGGLRELLGRDVSVEELGAALVGGFTAVLGSRLRPSARVA